MTGLTADAALAKRVARLEAIEAIRHLVQSYCFLVDDHDFDGIAACFATRSRYRTVDSLIDVSDRGPIRDYFRDRMANLGPTCHVTHDHVIELSDDDPARASGRVTSHAEVALDGEPMAICLRYEDQYVVEGRRWCFAERVMRFFYYCPTAEYPAILKNRRRKVLGGVRREADIPEALPGWSGQRPEG